MDEEEPLVRIPGAVLRFEHSDERLRDEIFGVGVGSGMPQRDRVQPLANVALRQLGAHESGGGCVVLDHDGDRPSHRGDRDRIVAITGLRARQGGGIPRCPLSQGREGSPARARGSARALAIFSRATVWSTTLG